jgi:hypothetical protein
VVLGLCGYVMPLCAKALSNLVSVVYDDARGRRFLLGGVAEVPRYTPSRVV